jgi:general secretion pathway protein G
MAINHVNSNKGFTLLELLIVITIISIIISIASANYSLAQKRTRDTRRISDMKEVQNAFEQYYGDMGGTYPATCSIDLTKYLPSGWPTDPRNVDPWPSTPETKYTYDFSNSHCLATSYCFCAHLEGGGGNSSSIPADAACVFGSGSYYCIGNLQ